MAFQMRLKEIRFFTVTASKILLPSMEIHVGFQKFAHEEFLVTSFELANEFWLLMIIKMCSKIIHTREKFSTKF